MEAMSVLGFVLAHTSVTASKGAILVTSYVEVIRTIIFTILHMYKDNSSLIRMF